MIIKALPYLLVAMASMAAGFFGGARSATRTAEAVQVPCPDCKCPPAAIVKLAPDFDVSKLNNKKGTFEYSPQTTFTNVTILIDPSDTVLLRALADKIDTVKK